MRIFAEYIKRHSKTYLLFVVFAAVFYLVFSLAELPAELVLYAAGICAFIGSVAMLIDYCQYAKKHRQLEGLLARITRSIEELPEAGELIERDYQTLLKIVYEDKVRITSNMDERYSDMMNYYTLWAHQIKTPIAAMRLLLQTTSQEENAELLQELFKIEQYVEMVLQYLRLDSQENDFLFQKYDLDNIIKQAVKKYANQFIRKKISLQYEDVNTEVVTDEKWLVFVIEQLLSNALKYTQEGSISIALEEGLVLVIHDTGIGISSEDIPRVFERGYTGYNGRTFKKSTGIGLYLCKRILSRLGHTISIESVPGAGTTVKVSLQREEYG